jgi:hypothetical protein
VEVAVLNRDPQIRKKLRQVVEPLRREGVDRLEIRSDEKPSVELGEEDVPAFEVPESEDAVVVSQQEIDVYLDVLTAELETGTTRKWRFGGIGETFMAPIEDPEFLEKVAQHEEVFGAGDQLYAKVQIIQKRDPGTAEFEPCAALWRSTIASKLPNSFRCKSGPTKYRRCSVAARLKQTLAEPTRSDGTV